MSLTVSFVPWIYQELENPWFKIENTKQLVCSIFHHKPREGRLQILHQGEHGFPNYHPWVVSREQVYRCSQEVHADGQCHESKENTKTSN